GQQYFVYHHTAADGGAASKYLVDETGAPQFLVDPGINGTHHFTADGQHAVTKFDAPKATLMSYIIKGILNRQLPWGLVLFGVMIALTLEMSGISSLAFAVGVYLPLSSSSPIFIGGMIRWLVDRYIRRKHRGKNLSEDELAAEGDKSPGVLMASGYIAGGAIAGILIAFMAGVPFMQGFNDKLDRLALDNPFATGASADLLSCLPFLALMLLLYLVGREVILAPKKARS
ncbi:MAG TPA: OPT/YSL family transporter, partial [Planctomycetota bacterium]|nr:OPT/YSL family transporter [Planctomycetota bacterium]